MSTGWTVEYTAADIGRAQDAVIAALGEYPGGGHYLDDEITMTVTKGGRLGFIATGSASEADTLARWLRGKRKQYFVQEDR